MLSVKHGFLRQVSVQLVEASDHIMGSFDEKLIDYTTGLLENRKVSFPLCAHLRLSYQPPSTWCVQCPISCSPAGRPFDGFHQTNSTVGSSASVGTVTQYRRQAQYEQLSCWAIAFGYPWQLGGSAKQERDIFGPLVQTNAEEAKSTSNHRILPAGESPA